MTASNQVSALRVADEEFLIASTIERCPKTMMVRKLFMNAIEATTNQMVGPRVIELKVKSLSGFPKIKYNQYRARNVRCRATPHVRHRSLNR
jgi:hypothetical protein